MILALDLGTSCGWCLRNGSTLVASGAWDLRPKRFEGGGMRFMRFANNLRQVHELNKLDLIAYEEVRRHLSTDSAHCYGGFQSHLLVFAEENEIPLTAYPVGTIKKFATGRGNANKNAMVMSAKDKWPTQEIESHDQADALWIGELATQDYDPD